MEILDSHGTEARYKKWRKSIKRVKGLSEEQSKVIIQYLDDLEEGRNVAKGVKKGKRSYSRIYANLIKLRFIFRLFKKRKIVNLKIKEDDVLKFFTDMRNGKIKKQDGQEFKSTGDYAKTFVGFWHWYQRYQKKKGKIIEDITTDLDTSRGEENTFVYFTKEDLEKSLKHFTKAEALMLLFMFDSIIRFPKELQNIRRQDITETDGYTWLNIRDETSKTYGRRFKLLLCADKLKEYIKDLEPTDFVFNVSPPMFNQKLKKVFVKVLENKMTLGGKKTSEISGYDVRHSGACHWRKGAYNTKIDALMYRGGWTDLRILNYYTKKLGMKDTINEDDLLTLEDKTRMEKDIEQLKKDLNEQRELHKKSLYYIKQGYPIRTTEAGSLIISKTKAKKNKSKNKAKKVLA